jgi:hypothetical protein
VANFGIMNMKGECDIERLKSQCGLHKFTLYDLAPIQEIREGPNK